MNKNLDRKHNLDKVIGILLTHENLFASDLMKLTSLSLVTINSLLKELVAQGIVKEGTSVQGILGRPSIVYHLNFDFYHSLHLSIQDKNPELCIE